MGQMTHKTYFSLFTTIMERLPNILRMIDNV